MPWPGGVCSNVLARMWAIAEFTNRSPGMNQNACHNQEICESARRRQSCFLKLDQGLEIIAVLPWAYKDYCHYRYPIATNAAALLRCKPKEGGSLVTGKMCGIVVTAAGIRTATANAPTTRPCTFATNCYCTPHTPFTEPGCMLLGYFFRKHAMR